MNDFLNKIRTKFGDGAALVCEIWINFYLHRRNDADYLALVKTQMYVLTHTLNIDSKLFNKLVEESNTFLQKHEQTIH